MDHNILHKSGGGATFEYLRTKLAKQTPENQDWKATCSCEPELKNE